ncbi:Unknown protein [Striga hermonthica]|uniref:Uncharacterized protein n=1 Tax=Striga hermonthica TaxID=68872 RepID=A0A9N7R5M8_STRHE|nr:Unknown protein [Striga hermonthica]
MASNVFGQAITEEVVEMLFPNANPITNLHRAEAALLHINAGEKATNVTTFVHNLKAAWGTGTSTLGMVYNATGGTISLMRAHSWEGSAWRASFPQVVQNGQWFGFLFVRNRLLGPAKGALVYRGRDNSGSNRDWLISWDNTRMNYQNHVFAQVRLSTSLNSLNWATIDTLMLRQFNNFSVSENGGFASVGIGAGSSPEFVGILSLAGLSPRAMTHATDLSVIYPSLDSKYNDLDATEEGIDATEEGTEEDDKKSSGAADAAPPAAAAPSATTTE